MDDIRALPLVYATRPGIALGPLSDIADGKARGFVLQFKESRFHGFVLREGGSATGFVDRCPHAGVPLAQELDQYLSSGGDYVMCSWHGALFDRQSGTCVGGPCKGQSLTPWPVAVVDSAIVTA
jgi:nitrite reductase/ring-hydroxylating ferredoxin subunit